MTMNDDEGRIIGSADCRRQRLRDIRSMLRGGFGPAGANGVTGVTSGWRKLFTNLDLNDLKISSLYIAGLAILTMVVNVLTAQTESADIALWEPVVWEVSSILMVLALIWIPWLAIALSPPEKLSSKSLKSKVSFVVVHATALGVFSVLHVTGFVAIRGEIYRQFTTWTYDFGDRFGYELRKDLMTYLLLTAVFWLVRYLRLRDVAVVKQLNFDIRDGNRIIRTPLIEILAVTSAGNYVEFQLADGRRPLMRTTLSTVESQLKENGFVRSHRSWLINREKVTGLRPGGSGDWTVELGNLEAPLSRRYPQALVALKMGAADHRHPSVGSALRQV